MAVTKKSSVCENVTEVVLVVVAVLVAVDADAVAVVVVFCSSLLNSISTRVKYVCIHVQILHHF